MLPRNTRVWIIVVVLLVGGIVVMLSSANSRRGTVGDGPYASIVRRAMPAIERSTGWKFTTPPKLEERDKQAVRSFLEDALNATTPAAELAGVEASYKRFGLLPESYNLRAELLDLLDEQIVGYYDPKTKVLYVVGGADPTILSTTIAHEMVHALQDQHFPLDSLERIRDNDRRTAAQSVAEGQAVWEQLVVLTGVANPANVMPGGWDGVRQMIREDRTGMPKLTNAPLILRETLLFPYLSGAEHVRQFKARRPGSSPFDSLPESTEQILHADRYFGERDHPTTIGLPPLGGGATRVYESDLGEFETRIYFFQHTRDVNLAAQAAAGWDGDRYILARLPGGGQALAWVTVWDTPLDAAEYVDALETALPRRYTGLKRVTGSAELRRYEGGGRSVLLRSVTVDGRSVVLLSDVPAGTAHSIVDPARIRLSS